MCATVQTGLFVSGARGHFSHQLLWVWISPLRHTWRPCWLSRSFHHMFHVTNSAQRRWSCFRESSSLTCTWSSSMPAAIIPSPASRYGGSTWRQIPLDDSLVGRSSPIVSSFTREVLGRTSMPGLLSSLCSFAPVLPAEGSCYCLFLSAWPLPSCRLPWPHADIRYVLMTRRVFFKFKLIIIFLLLYLQGCPNPDRWVY